MQLEPLNPYVCHALSTLEVRLRNFDRARAVLERVVWQKPTAAVCVSLAELERSQGDPDKAKSVLQHGLQRCSKDRTQLLLALAWLQEDAYRDIPAAMALLQEALHENPSEVKVHIAKASMELRLQRIEDAKATLWGCSALEAKDGAHFTMLGTLEMESGSIATARTVLATGHAKFPGDQFLLQRWGTLEAKHGDTAKARELFEKSVLIQPHAPTFVAWAILEEEEGVKALAPLPMVTHLNLAEADPNPSCRL